MFLHYEFDRKMCLISYKNSAIKSQSPENRLHFLFCKIHFLISLHFSVKFDPGFMWFRPGMCIVRCNHKHLDYTFVCIITYLERHSVLPLHSQTQSFLEMTWSALPIWQRSFKQRPVHSEAQRALIHAQHKPCLCPLSLSLSLSLSHTHSLSLFIYLQVCLATVPQSEALQLWVNLPPYWREMEGQMMLSDCRQGEELERFRSENHCFLLRWGHRGQMHNVIWTSNFFGPYYPWELLICRHLTCCDPELFHSFTLSHFFFTPLLSSCFWSMRHINHFLECSHSQGGSELLWSES